MLKQEIFDLPVILLGILVEEINCAQAKKKYYLSNSPHEELSYRIVFSR